MSKRITKKYSFVSFNIEFVTVFLWIVQKAPKTKNMEKKFNVRLAIVQNSIRSNKKSFIDTWMILYKTCNLLQPINIMQDSQMITLSLQLHRENDFTFQLHCFVVECKVMKIYDEFLCLLRNPQMLDIGIRFHCHVWSSKLDFITATLSTSQNLSTFV